MRSRGRPAAAVATAVALVASGLAFVGPVVTGPTAPAGAAVSSNTDQDYATVEFSDPWDFSNPEDFGAVNVQNLASWSVANGQLDAVSNAGGGFIMAETIAGSIPLGRSTTLHPINANNLRKVSFRIRSFSASTQPGGFFWYTCDHVIPDCENGFAFSVFPGTNDYSFDIPAQSTFRPGGPGWGGIIKGIRLVPSGSAQIHLWLDYLRLTPLAGSAMPPSPPTPLPVVDSPSAEGGVDYASLVRGDPWDMSQPSDILAPENMIYGFGSGLLNGLNAGPHIDDAHFTLPLNGPIDGNRFHHLTFDVYYEGPFSLDAGPGGGMVARLIWETVGSPGVWQDSDDIVVFPGWNKVSVDLATSPSWAITDPGTPVRIGWAGQQIRTVRFDPDEDSGQRRFLVDNIKLAEDATGYGGAYNVQFHDNAWRSGTTADIYASSSPNAFGGTQIAVGLPVSQGVNTFHWAPNPVNPGTYWIYVVLHRGGDTARAYGSGPVRMTSAPSPLYGVDPFGKLESASVGLSGVRVKGWALDPDTDGPIPVHFWVDGRSVVAALTASAQRDDVHAAFPSFGPDHGFNALIQVPQGTHSVCAYAINTGPGSNQQIGCRFVTVQNNPIGTLDSVTNAEAGVVVRGWALDPNSAGPIDVHVWVDGQPKVALRADRSRPDVGAAMPRYGANHGYRGTLTLPHGAHTVCTYGIDVGPGTNTALGCRTISV